MRLVQGDGSDLPKTYDEYQELVGLAEPTFTPLVQSSYLGLAFTKARRGSLACGGSLSPLACS